MMVGHCHLHDFSVRLDTFEYRGCWSCHHFVPADDFPYISIAIAAEELGVSPSTVRRWIYEGKLSAELFRRRKSKQAPAPFKWFIDTDSFEAVKRQRQSG